MAKWNYFDHKDLSDETFSGMNDFDAYQHNASLTAIYPKEVALEYTALGLTSEAGEYAGKIKKKIRDGVFNQHEAMAELGDTLWYIAMASQALGYTLSEVAEYNLQKLKDRQERNKLTGSGDFR